MFFLIEDSATARKYLLHQRVDAGISSVRLETIIDDKRSFVHVQFIAHVDVGVRRLLAHFSLLQLRVGSVTAQFGFFSFFLDLN